MSQDTLHYLEQPPTAEETFEAFNQGLEEPIISVLIDFPQFVQVGLLKPEFFSQLYTRYVVALILDHYEKYGVVPTREVLKKEALGEVREDHDFDGVFKLIDRRPTARETPYVRDKLKQWLRDRAYGLLYSETAQEAYHSRNFSVIDEIVEKAHRIYNFEQGEAFGFIDALDFMNQEITHEWLVEGVLVNKQAMLLGGKKKCLKTAILCDLAVSLATGTPFLNHFPIPKPRRVAFFSAESGEQDIQHRLNTIPKQKNATLERGYLFPSFVRPHLSDEEDLAKITDFVTRQKIEVVMIDPLYLTLLAGGKQSVASSDIYQMGAVFGNVADSIISAGATPILSHHFRKTINDTELDLDDFSMVGAAEFARQSLLIARRGDYTGPRNNQLVIRTHGYGRGERYSVHIDEGTLEAPHWGVTIETERETEARSSTTSSQQAESELLQALATITEELGRGVMKNELRKELGWSGDRITRVLNQAVENGHVQIEKGVRPLYSLTAS